MTKVLVISPHPDDETLGCGATLLKHRQDGDITSWLTVTSMKTKDGFSQAQITSRDDEIERVAIAFGFSVRTSLDFSATQLDAYPLTKIIGKFQDIISQIEPEVVYLPFPGDAHSDHGVVFNAAMACVKSFRYPFVKSVRLYETISETDFGIDPTKIPFQPNLFIDVSDFLDRKIEIMKIYEGEILPAPFPRSEETIRAQAVVRGAITGTSAAEAFMIIREIQ